MAIGTIQKVLVCGGSGVVVDVAGGVPRWVVCDGSRVTAVDTFLISSSASAAFESSYGEFDYTYASGLFSVAFTMVVGLYVVSRNFGVILNFIRHG